MQPQIHPEVADALAEGRPVVALESTIISHGLPRPDNLRVAREIEDSVRSGGAVPATIAVVDGVPRIGLDDDALDRVANDDSVVKVSVRDLGTLVARKGNGATTVAATSHLAALAGVRVFATGGLGGVHRGARDTWDESADLTTLSITPITVVCAGVKSILDVPATLERLETLNIPVLGYRTERFPGFYLADAGHPLDWSVQTPDAVADVLRARDALECRGGVVVVNPVKAEEELDRAVHDEVLAAGLAAADAAGVRGKDVTPFLLDYFHTATDGRSLAVNVALVRSNAVLAAQIAVALAR
ncbi:MAG TPA: pseudouridine-5'-phosphate glycosidase [Candidatus Nanopelagicales bacterium]|nr:pseudouridine-5'-phosphate glycosidase [Candidatus Nanopelagicales bacterium]